ncbi:MAG: hypothetical protein J5365_03445 [Erysipelotrichaceae bacterium]|nr:hypothetical protein [Erysipelotrichaceae bacterium]
MKKWIAVLLALTMLLTVAGCGKKGDNSLVGVWEYADTENDLGAVYDLKDDGTGTYTMKVGETEVTYELKYEVQDGHLLVRYVNNEIFSEDDVFDSEFSFKNADTIIVKDTSGMEMEFNRK